MIRQSFLQVGLHELNTAQRCGQNCDALLTRSGLLLKRFSPFHGMRVGECQLRFHT